MASRKDRLRKLVVLQEKLQSLHETRHAGYLAAAAAAHDDALELAARFDADDSLAIVFPDVYNRRISEASGKEQANRRLAEAEAKLVAAAKARGGRIEQAWRDVSRHEERQSADLERLETLGRVPLPKQPK